MPKHKKSANKKRVKKTKNKNTRKERAASVVRMSMRDYGKYVIEQRALVDHRDGLKPVQRRILYAMLGLGLRPTSSHQKCAATVGDTLRRFHPHGDQSLYGALVSMVHLRYPMIDGHGNFGDAETPPAAYRYTEARLSKIAYELLLADIEAAEMIPNYDGQHKEPCILPARLPLAVLNGTQGIAVGIAASIPPHNITELCSALIRLVKKPNTKTGTLVTKYLHGPDYGQGVLLSKLEEVEALYEQGDGSLTYRCKYHFETEKKSGNRLLVIDELAPGFTVTGLKKGKNSFVARCEKLISQGVIISVNNESSEKTRVVVEFKDSDLLKEHVLPMLETKIGYNLNAVTRSAGQMDDIDITSKKYSMRRMLTDFLDFRRDIETILLNIDKKRTEEKLLREEAILAAIININKVTAAQKKAKTGEEFIKLLKTSLKIKLEQAEIIARTPVIQLIQGNRAAQEGKIKELKSRLKEIKSDLGNIDSVVIRTLKATRKQFGDERGTALEEKAPRMPRAADSKYLSMDEDGKVERHDDIPTRVRRPFTEFISATSNTAFVNESGEFMVRKTTTVSKTSIDGLVGIAPVHTENDKLVIANADGEFGIIELAKPVVRAAKNFVSCSKMDAEFCAAIGKKDKLIVAAADGGKVRHFEFGYDDLPAKRRGSLPNGKLIKDDDCDEIIGLIVVREGQKVLTQRGKELSKVNNKLLSDAVVIVGEESNMIEADGKKLESGLNDAVNALKDYEDVYVFPL